MAAYIDRLPEGSAIGDKALAAHIAAYGQQACATSLRSLSHTGHLRLIKEHLVLTGGGFRWVTRTHFSRTARDDAWWKAFVAGLHGVDLTELERRQRQEAADAPGSPDDPGGEDREDGEDPADPADPADREDPEAGETVPPATAQPACSLAYRTLAQLGRTEPRMTLSAADCAALEVLAAEWLARGATPDHLTVSLTAGLPHPLHSPAAIARKRLETKMPPEPVSAQTATEAAARPGRVLRTIVMCITCENDETNSTIISGVCVDCRKESGMDTGMDTKDGTDTGPGPGDATRTLVDTARRAAEIRAAAGLKSRRGKGKRKR
ncbi:hypothetical protein [Streptomyces sp. NPDC091212]|uniref:hypothetical protein n=1 Tax=Streptomyces sp. NPDC091212 TaxID=3155191 RepID=UPI00342FABE7